MTVTITRDWSYDGKSAKFSMSALGDVYTFPSRCADGMAMDVRGTFVGTLLMEGSVDGINWTQITLSVNQATGAAGVTSFTAAGQAVFCLGGFTSARVRCSAYTSGTFTVCLEDAEGLEWSQVLNALPAGSNLVGDFGMQVRATSGGIATAVRMLSAGASVNNTLVKASAGRLWRIVGYNAAASVKYLKIYNKATTPAAGTDTPVLTFALKPTSDFNIDLGPYGYYLSTGIGFAITGASPDADTTALVAADVVGLNVLYT